MACHLRKISAFRQAFRSFVSSVTPDASSAPRLPDVYQASSASWPACKDGRFNAAVSMQARPLFVSGLHTSVTGAHRSNPDAALSGNVFEARAQGNMLHRHSLIPLVTRYSSDARGAAVHRHYHSSNMHGTAGFIGTTVLCVRKNGQVVMMADGQVTRGNEIIKPNVCKLRRIGKDVIGAFAGATADAFTLFERLEMKLEEHPGQLMRSAVELAKAWRADKFLRRLDATMVVADAQHSLTITGDGDVLEPHDGIIGIGSGGSFAVAAARALIDVPGMEAEEIVKRSMNIAADMCIYTNHNFVSMKLGESLAKKDAGEPIPAVPSPVAATAS